MRSDNGFTLIELMIVVTIVSVLAAIALSQYSDYVIRAQVSEGASLAAGAKEAVADFYSKTGHFPDGPCMGSNESVGLAQPSSIAGSYVSQVFVAGEGCAASLEPGSIVTIFSSNEPQHANAGIDTAGLIFEPTNQGGSISWACKKFLFAGNVVLKDNWVPTSCR